MEAVTVIRRPELYFGGAPPETLVEAPQNIFYHRVKADSATLQRMSFTARSPAAGLLCHPVAWVECELKIKESVRTDLLSQTVGPYAARVKQNNIAQGANGNVFHDACGLIAFGQGDSFGAGLDHCSVVLNGSSYTQQNLDRWWSPFVRFSIKDDDAQERYSRCGGKFDQFDSSGSMIVTSRANNVDGVTGFGISPDSGVMKRAQNYYNSTVSVDPGQVAAGGFHTASRTIRIRWPLNAGPFNPFFGMALNRINPYRSYALGLSNINQLSVDLLMKSNFTQTLLRKLHRDKTGFDGGLDATNYGMWANRAIQVELVSDSTFLELKYYRLAPGRAIPSVQNVPIYKIMTHAGSTMPAAADAGNGIELLGNVNLSPFGDGSLTYMAASGNDLLTTPAASQLAPNFNFYKMSFSTLSLPMCPSMLMIVAAKDTGSYGHQVSRDNAIVGEHTVVNRDACASILSVRLTVNTSEQVIQRSDDAARVLDQDRLWRSTIRNAVEGYFGGDFNSWANRQCCVMISSDEFSQLGISPGVIAPLTLKIDIEMQNRAVYYDSICEGFQGAGNANDAIRPRKCIDKLRVVPYIIAFYSRGVVSISPASAVTSVQSLAQHTASNTLAGNT